jgi:apolipoprotein N-acyltransferase
MILGSATRVSRGNILCSASIALWNCVPKWIRAVNPGVSVYIDSIGLIRAKTYPVDLVAAPREADAILSEVALIEEGHTIYAAVGDLFGYLNAAAAIYLWLILPRWQRRKIPMP